MTDDASLRTAKLPLVATVKAAYALTWANLRSFGTVAMVWGPVVFVVMFAIHWLLWPYGQGDPSLSAMIGSTMPVMLVSALVGATAAVAWHRLVLADNAIRPDQVLRYDRTVIYYAGWVLGLVVIGFLIFLAVPLIAVGLAEFLPSNSPESPAVADSTDQTSGQTLPDWAASLIIIVGAILFGPFAYPAIRLMPILPAIAIGAPHGAGAVWRATRGQFWRLYLGTLLAALPALVPYFFIFDFKDRTANSLWAAALEVSWLVCGLVFVTFLSLAYRHFFPAGAAGGHTPRAD